jgi:hypothetical protein
MTALAPTKQLGLLGRLHEDGVLTPTALNLRKLNEIEAIPFETYQDIGLMLGTLRDATAWWIGDWLVWGEGAYGEKAAQAAELLRREPHTLTTYFRVSMYVSPRRRRSKLAWTHHRAVASLPPEEQTEWLRLAEDERLTAGELSARIKGKKDGDSVLAGRNGDDPDAEIDVGRVTKLVKRLWAKSVDEGDGWWRVPGELMVQLATAIGEDV